MAISSHLKLKGFCPITSLLPIGPREGEQHINEEDIYSLLDSKEGEEVCLILLGGVNYLTGQVLDMKNISKKAKEKGVIVGFDLAHAVGNIELKLHEWGTDFAVWCTYKYLNSGPGGIGGCFVHEKYANDFTIPRLSGWWAHDKRSRFLMGSSLELQEGAFGFQISNPPILCLASLRASLDIYEEAGMKAFTEKSKLLTGKNCLHKTKLLVVDVFHLFLDYLESLLMEKLPKSVNIITPFDSGKRGCQLSLTLTMGRKVLKLLKEKGVVCDFREPNFVRVAPNPLYNTFADVWNFVNILSLLLCQRDE
jgi:kynureninase